ncbi:MAG: ComF family protein [Lachnospiraceae bacterium]|nr:ComF family protein [Lachnospiraceae bacterium]
MLKSADILPGLLFPRRCPLCDRVLPYGERICEQCADEIIYEKEPRCMKCGRSLENEGASMYCADCERHSHVYDHGYCMADYRSVARAIYRMKYKNRRQNAEWFGDEMARKLGREILALRPQVLVPVPLHAKRMRKRGYNQAADLAKALSARLKIPVREDLIRRVRNTPPMKDLDSEEKRRNNMKNAFQLGSDVVKYDRIMIVDDVYTSGTTIDAVAREFRKAGVLGIFFVTVASAHL